MRFVAFLAVFGHHALPRDGAHSRWLKEAVNTLGFGLCLFFVLSAYLIALLLRRERQKTDTVALRAFYARRIYASGRYTSWAWDWLRRAP